jgi:hypothetical protein
MRMSGRFSTVLLSPYCEPHGWVVMRVNLDPELDGLTEAHTAQLLLSDGQPASRRSDHELRNAAPAIASSDPLGRRFIRAAQSAIRDHPCQENHGLIKRGAPILLDQRLQARQPGVQRGMLRREGCRKGPGSGAHRPVRQYPYDGCCNLVGCGLRT